MYKEHDLKLVEREIYGLALEEGLIYIGYTSNFKRRLRQHRRNKGAIITSIFKPIGIVFKMKLGRVSHFEAIAAEYIVTLEMMLRIGEMKVFGASFLSIDRKPIGIKKIEELIREHKRKAVKWQEYSKFGGYDPNNI